MKSMIFYILTVLLSMVTLTACGILPHEGKELIELPNVQTADQIKQNTTRTREQARRLLSQKDYIGTIDLIQKELRKGVDEKVLSKEYLQAANTSLSQADTLMKGGHYSKAALLLRTVLGSYPRSLKLQEQVAASPAQIKVKIDLCSDKLMEAGLLAYRSGELAASVNIWQQILEFDPQHKAAQNSIQTTQQQLSKLKALNNNKD